MKGKDDIAQLFQKELGNYQAKVRPDLWNSIQAGITNAGVATGTATSMSLATKIAIGVGTAAAITVGTIMVSNKSSKPEGKAPQEMVEQLPVVPDTSAENPAVQDDTLVLEQKDIVQKETTAAPKHVEKTTEEQEIAKASEEPVLAQTENDNASPVRIEEPVTLLQPKTSTQLKEPISTPSTVGDIPASTEKVNEALASTIIVEKRGSQELRFSIDNLPENAQVIWDFGDDTAYDTSEKPQHFYYASGRYTVHVEIIVADAPPVKKSTVVEVQIKGKIGELPNIFTPNGDGRNDVFYIESKNLRSFELTVMDGQQNVVFSTKDPNFRWDGIDRYGNPVKDGRYIYVIVAEDEAGNAINKYQELVISR